MSLTRRSMLIFSGGSIAELLLSARCSWAEAWPQRSLRVIVGFQVGGTADVVARLAGRQLEALIGTPVVIENRAGASGVMAANFVRTTDDDHTLLMVSETYIVTPLINGNAGFKVARDFKLIGVVAEGPQVVLATSDAPFHTFDEFAKFAGRASTGVAYATSGFGHPQHLIGEYLAAKLPAKLVHVPTRGGGAAVNDLLTGTVNLAILGLGPTFRLIQAGRLVPLAVSTAKRVSALPQVPTLAELGFSGFSAPQWLGFVAPRTLADAHVNLLSSELQKASGHPALRENFAALGLTPVFLGAAEMAARIAEEEERWRSIVVAAHLVSK